MEERARRRVSRTTLAERPPRGCGDYRTSASST
jgi:hypothetical protein